MSRRVVRAVAATLIFMLSMSVSGLAIAAPSETPIDHMEITASKIFDEVSEIDYKAAVSDDTALPAKITILGPSDAKLISMGTFDGTNTDEIKDIDYEQETTPEGYIAYTVELTNARAINAKFEGPKLTGTDTNHLMLTLGWKVASATKSMFMGALVPQDFVGSGGGVELLGAAPSGERIYGKSFFNVAAGTVDGVAIALIAAENIAPTNGENPNAPAAKTGIEGIIQKFGPNFYLLLGIAILTLILLVVLIVLIIKSRRPKLVEYYEIEDDESDDEEYETESGELEAQGSDELKEEDTELRF